MIKSAFEALHAIKGPLTLVGFLAALVFGVAYTLLRQQRGLDFLSGIIREKTTRDSFYRLASQSILYLFVLSCLAMILGFGSWTVANSPNKGVHEPAKHEELAIESISYTDRGELDVVVKNIGNVAEVINRVDVTVVKDHKIDLNPLLEGVKLMIPIQNVPEGESRGVNTAVEVPAGGAERLLIGLNTTRVLTIRLTLHYGANLSVSRETKISLDS